MTRNRYGTHLYFVVCIRRCMMVQLFSKCFLFVSIFRGNWKHFTEGDEVSLLSWILFEAQIFSGLFAYPFQCVVWRRGLKLRPEKLMLEVPPPRPGDGWILYHSNLCWSLIRHDNQYMNSPNELVVSIIDGGQRVAGDLHKPWMTFKQSTCFKPSHSY